MVQSDLLRHLVQTLETLGIPYLITGSVASITYGEPRFTKDIDVVVDLKSSQVADLCKAFPEPEYYCSVDAATQAVRQRSQFNVLQLTTGLKVDIIIAGESAFDRSRLARGIRMPVGVDFAATFAAPEDVAVKKLEYFKMGGSEKHLRDIAGMMKVQAKRVDNEYLSSWIARLGLSAEWQLVKNRLEETSS
jgi:hypothetical protein